MGRSRARTKKTPVINVGAKPTSTSEPPSISSLLTKAQALVSQCDYDLAQLFVQRILERSPNNVEARELLGVIQLEKGDVDDAKHTFESLIPSTPDIQNPPPASAHLYLAQLSEDSRLALEHYQAGVNILHSQLKGKDSNLEVSKEDGDIKRMIVGVLVAMVELWMAPTSDLCFDPKAEETCEALMKMAFEMDADNVDALICLASLRLSQQRPEDAKQCAVQAWSACKDLDADDPLLPPIPTRLELTKRFLELSEYPQALLVLQGIMASDDQEVEAWYLEGWCYFLMAEQAKETGSKLDSLAWEELAQNSRDCLENCGALHKSQEHPDEQLLEHTLDLIAQLEALNIKPSPEGDEDGADDADDWEDLSDDGDIEMG